VRRTAVTLLLGCLLMAVGLFVAAPASACSCVGSTTQEFFDLADAVFTGTLVSRESPAGSEGSTASPALHVFAVDTVIKGTAHEQQGVVSPDSGASCGLELSGTGPFVVFASRSADLGGTPFTHLAEDQYAAFLCGGTGPVTPAVEAELQALGGQAAGLGPTAGALPGAVGTDVASLDEGVPLWALALGALGVLACGLGAGWLLRWRRTSP
jgi:hypothetical protein